METRVVEQTFPPNLANFPMKPIPAVVYNQSVRALPYFAHQQLDLDYFPEELGVPLCACPATGGITGWEADVDSGVGADDESEMQSDVQDENAKAKTKASHKRKAKDSPRTRDKQDVKRMKVRGGRPAVAKKVTADLDSDDELIVQMKERRYLEKDIAQALIDQGRTAYNPKTIGTRWRRIKAALQRRQDELLDADLSDWHEGDDDVLIDAINKSEKEVRRLKAEIEKRKWRMVADMMKKQKPVLNFSHGACRKRFEALVAGTAKPTPESIKNPTPEIRARVESRAAKQRRIDEQSPAVVIQEQNVAANGWTSRQRFFF